MVVYAILLVGVRINIKILICNSPFYASLRGVLKSKALPYIQCVEGGWICRGDITVFGVATEVYFLNFLVIILIAGLLNLTQEAGGSVCAAAGASTFFLRWFSAFTLVWMCLSATRHWVGNSSRTGEADW